MTNNFDEINEKVAKALGVNFTRSDDCRLHSLRCPAYSTNIEAAWEIVKHVEERGSNVLLQHRRDYIRDGWSCVIDEAMDDSDTAPLAICRSFLKLKETEGK